MVRGGIAGRRDDRPAGGTHGRAGRRTAGCADAGSERMRTRGACYRIRIQPLLARPLFIQFAIHGRTLQRITYQAPDSRSGACNRLMRLKRHGVFRHSRDAKRMAGLQNRPVS